MVVRKSNISPKIDVERESFHLQKGKGSMSSTGKSSHLDKGHNHSKISAFKSKGMASNMHRTQYVESSRPGIDVKENDYESSTGAVES